MWRSGVCWAHHFILERGFTSREARLPISMISTPRFRRLFFFPEARLVRPCRASGSFTEQGDSGDTPLRCAPILHHASFAACC